MEEDGTINMLLDGGSVARPKDTIKVVGVGNAGCKAVEYMYHKGIVGVGHVLCNTEAEQLCHATVPIRIQLGLIGEGGSNDPLQAAVMAEESITSVKACFESDTRIVFVVAGLGGGTGTGAAPIIAKAAREQGILTVAVITLPFRYELSPTIDRALEGLEHLGAEVDALLVINNESLRTLFPDFTLSNALKKADDTLVQVVSTVVEMLTMRGMINMDFNNVRRVLQQAGVAVVAVGYGSGTQRITQAIAEALHSPLVQYANIYEARKLLLVLSFPATEGELTLQEIKELEDFAAQFRDKFNVQLDFGLVADTQLQNRVKITILAAGFGIDIIPGMKERLTAAQHEAQQQRIERELELRRRRIYFYGEEAERKLERHQYGVYIFATDELDNEYVVKEIEQIPTIQRKMI